LASTTVSGLIVSTTTTTTAINTGISPTNAAAAGTSGYIQFDGLIVTSVSSSSSPNPTTQIFAQNPAYPTVIDDGASTSAPSSTALISCEQFATDSATTGTPMICPTPSLVATLSTATTSNAYYNPYAVQLDASTQLLLSDRTTAVLGNITSGDTINVYGYYNADGTINAEIVRDLSKPIGAGATGVSSTLGATALGTTDDTSTLQAELNQLTALVAQLSTEVATQTASVTLATTTPLTTGTECPMIPAGSTVGCVGIPSSTATDTIYM
jgi:hypothetical protein